MKPKNILHVLGILAVSALSYQNAFAAYVYAFGVNNTWTSRTNNYDPFPGSNFVASFSLDQVGTNPRDGTVYQRTARGAVYGGEGSEPMAEASVTSNNSASTMAATSQLFWQYRFLKADGTPYQNVSIPLIIDYGVGFSFSGDGNTGSGSVHMSFATAWNQYSSGLFANYGGFRYASVWGSASATNPDPVISTYTYENGSGSGVPVGSIAVDIPIGSTQNSYWLGLTASASVSGTIGSIGETQTILDPFLQINPASQFAQDGGYVAVHTILADGSSDWVPASRTPSPLNTVPVPTAVWLFGSGLIGLIGVARRKKL